MLPDNNARINSQSNIIVMKDEAERYKISRKPLKGKTINGKINKLRKNNSSGSSTHRPEQKKKEDIERNMIIKFNEQSISFIAKNHQGSFISNGHDRSIDSFDKILYGVEELLALEDNSREDEPNYSMLYRQFQKLCKSEQQESSEVATEELQLEDESKNAKQNSWEEHHNQLLGKLLREKLQEVKEIRKNRGSSNIFSSDPNISIRLLGGANLSEIHEEQIQHDSSIHRMDPIEEEFIDFVNKGQGTSKINISKIEQKTNLKEEKKVVFKEDTLKETEQDQVVAMLENELVSRGEAQEQSINEQQLSLKKNKKESFFKQNYKHILEQLDDNEERKLDTSHVNMLGVLAKRTEWIQSRKDKTAKWRKRQLQMISRFRQIMQNPYAQFSDEEDFQLQI